MKTAADAKTRFVLLGSTAKGSAPRVLPPSVWVCHDRSELESAIASATKRTTWVSFTRSSTDLLLERPSTPGADLRGSRLITLTPPRSESIPALLGLFHPVFGLGEGSRWLPTSELVEAITTDDASDRFIGGSVDRKAKTLTLLRGDITAIVAPFRLFRRSGDGTAPDFARLRLTDYGRTIALGDYEASADAVLYELDPDYRRRLNRQRRDQRANVRGGSAAAAEAAAFEANGFRPDLRQGNRPHRAQRGREAACEDPEYPRRSARSSSGGDRRILIAWCLLCSRSAIIDFTRKPSRVALS